MESEHEIYLNDERISTVCLGDNYQLLIVSSPKRESEIEEFGVNFEVEGSTERNELESTSLEETISSFISRHRNVKVLSVKVPPMKRLHTETEGPSKTKKKVEKIPIEDLDTDSSDDEDFPITRDYVLAEYGCPIEERNPFTIARYLARARVDKKNKRIKALQQKVRRLNAKIERLQKLVKEREPDNFFM